MDELLSLEEEIVKKIKALKLFFTNSVIATQSFVTKSAPNAENVRG